MNIEVTQLYTGLSHVCAKYLGKRFILTSGDRNCTQQLRISGESSFHLVGEAFDAQVYPYNRNEQAWLGSLAEQVGFRWGGKFTPYDDVHFDNGNRRTPGHCR